MSHWIEEPREGFDRITVAIDAIREGGMVVVVDDEDRENEGDLCMAAEKVTPEAINFMAKYGRGLICLAMTSEKCDAGEFLPAGGTQDIQFHHLSVLGVYLGDDLDRIALHTVQHKLLVGRQRLRLYMSMVVAQRSRRVLRLTTSERRPPKKFRTF